MWEYSWWSTQGTMTSTYRTNVCWLQRPKPQHSAPQRAIWLNCAQNREVNSKWSLYQFRGSRAQRKKWPYSPSSSGRHFEHAGSWQSGGGWDWQKDCWGRRLLPPQTTASSAWIQQTAPQLVWPQVLDLPSWQLQRRGVHFHEQQYHKEDCFQCYRTFSVFSWSYGKLHANFTFCRKKEATTSIRLICSAIIIFIWPNFRSRTRPWKTLSELGHLHITRSPFTAASWSGADWQWNRGWDSALSSAS